jgi:hypothetical protein
MPERQYRTTRDSGRWPTSCLQIHTIVMTGTFSWSRTRKSLWPLQIVFVKTNIEIFDKQRTKLEEVQFVDCGTRLDSTSCSGRTIAVTTPVAIAIAMATAIAITFIAFVVLLLIITYFNWRASISKSRPIVMP